ncbi:hypothetical protein EMIT0373P_10472 [Pseudomonas chlororaphis]
MQRGHLIVDTGITHALLDFQGVHGKWEGPGIEH